MFLAVRTGMAAVLACIVLAFTTDPSAAHTYRELSCNDAICPAIRAQICADSTWHVPLATAKPSV